jgi:hypothetical protein
MSKYLRGSRKPWATPGKIPFKTIAGFDNCRSAAYEQSPRVQIYLMNKAELKRLWRSIARGAQMTERFARRCVRVHNTVATYELDYYGTVRSFPHVLIKELACVPEYILSEECNEVLLDRVHRAANS